MNILVLNCGSSSLKYQLINMDDESVIAKGLVKESVLKVLFLHTSQQEKINMLLKHLCQIIM